MKIWFDFTNAPHINFFASMVRELQKNHEVIITARDHSNTLSLLDAEQFPYIIVGRHYGAGMLSKLYGFIDRVLGLRKVLKNQNIDVAISHSSFYSPLVARLIGARSIYLNDNEHALGNIPAFLFATLIMVPETVSLEKIAKQGAARGKTVQYPGVKEAIYLQDMAGLGDRPDVKDVRQTIYIRPEPWNAQYYKGDKAFLDSLIRDLVEKYSVVVLPRGKDQASHYIALAVPELKVITDSLPLATIYASCDLFIGAGGTMTRELAILGVPTISVYQDELLDVDRFLIEQGYMLHNHRPDMALVESALAKVDSVSAANLMRKGVLARQLIMQKLYELGNR